jgi:hypothetical protein
VHQKHNDQSERARRDTPRSDHEPAPAREREREEQDGIGMPHGNSLITSHANEANLVGRVFPPKSASRRVELADSAEPGGGRQVLATGGSGQMHSADAPC